MINAQDLANAVALAMQQVIGPLTAAVTAGIQAANQKPPPPPKTPPAPAGFFKSLFPELSKSIKEAKDALKDWKDRLGKRTKLGNVGSAINASPQILSGLVSAPGKTALGAAGAAGGAAQGAISSLNSVFGPIASIVEKMNPAAVEMFSRAMDDLTAVMGDLLLPILEAGTGLVRRFADILNSIVPAFDPIIEVIVELVGIMADLLLPIFEAVTPLIQLFGAILKSMMPVVQFLADIFKKVLGVIGMFTKALVELWNTLANSWIGRRLGLKGITEVKPSLDKSSVGKAIYSTGFTSAEELGKASRAAALKGGIGKSYDQQTAENTRLTALNTASIPGAGGIVERLAEHIEELKKSLEAEKEAPDPGAPPI